MGHGVTVRCPRTCVCEAQCNHNATSTRPDPISKREAKRDKRPLACISRFSTICAAHARLCRLLPYAVSVFLMHIHMLVGFFPDPSSSGSSSTSLSDDERRQTAFAPLAPPPLTQGCADGLVLIDKDEMQIYRGVIMCLELVPADGFEQMYKDWAEPASSPPPPPLPLPPRQNRPPTYKFAMPGVLIRIVLGTSRQ